MRVKAKNVHGPSRTFSPPAFDDEPLCCSPLDASLEELQAELPEVERQGSWLDVLARFLQKKHVPQLKQLTADLQIEAPQTFYTSKSDRINSIIRSSQGGSVDAALSEAAAVKQKACAAAKAELANTQRDVEERKVTKAETELANVKLMQQALKQAAAAKAKLPQPPTSPSPGSADAKLIDGLLSEGCADGRAAPGGLTKLKLKNIIKKWAMSDDISESSLQQCYKVLGNKGQRDKKTLISELFSGYEETVKFLRLPGPIPDKKLALIYRANRDMPPPPVDGTDRAAMVDELSGWLLNEGEEVEESEEEEEEEEEESGGAGEEDEESEEEGDEELAG